LQHKKQTVTLKIDGIWHFKFSFCYFRLKKDILIAACGQILHIFLSTKFAWPHNVKIRTTGGTKWILLKRKREIILPHSVQLAKLLWSKISLQLPLQIPQNSSLQIPHKLNLKSHHLWPRILGCLCLNS
jgi:hypothetical protein